MRGWALCFVSLVVWADPISAERNIRIKLDPPGRTAVVSIRSVRSPEAKPILRSISGTVTVALPADFAPPWIIEAEDFDPVTVAETDLRGGRPAVLRAYGQLRGVIERQKPRKDDRFTLILKRADRAGVQETELSIANDNRFEVGLSAGIYSCVIVGSNSASRIRSGVVVLPSAVTDLERVRSDPTMAISFRVVDAKNGTPVSGAKVLWDPAPDVLNVAAARALYEKLWSSTTQRDGRFSLTSIGPLPLPARWRVEANGYAPAYTEQVQLREDRRFGVSDVRLRPRGTIELTIDPPRHGSLPRGKVLLLDPDPTQPHAFTRTAETPLHAGETRFTNVTYGAKRILIENDKGMALCYHDFTAVNEVTRVTLEVEPVEITGRVTRANAPVDRARVVFADPHNARTIVAEAETGPAGDYTATTYQRGQLYGYVTRSGGPGTVSGAASKQVEIAPGQREAQADFALGSSGLTVMVVDAKSGAAIPRAVIDRRLDFSDGHRVMGLSETDDRGRLVLDNYSDGMATLFIRASGYRAREISLPLRQDLAETRIALDPTDIVQGHVTSAEGLPIEHALIVGGYQNELSYQAAFQTATDSAGSFRFESAPPIGTPFYVVASGFALGFGTLHSGRDNVFILRFPSTKVVRLTADGGAPLTKVFRVVAATHGGEMIPIGVLDDLARFNGMEQYQLLGTGRDGAVVLSEFLGIGTFDLYITRKGGSPFRYERIATVRAPLEQNELVAIRE